jgi:uncharacterized protein YciI
MPLFAAMLQYGEDAERRQEVQQLLTNDPFAQNGIIEAATIKEWKIVISRDL